jgi:hypothetical protein
VLVRQNPNAESAETAEHPENDAMKGAEHNTIQNAENAKTQRTTA